MPAAEFPPVIEIQGRKFVTRSQLEFYKKRVLARAMGAPAPTYEAPTIETFVPLPQAATELGVSRRTIGRRMATRAPEPAAA